jgi:hypothetical protein
MLKQILFLIIALLYNYIKCSFNTLFVMIRGVQSGNIIISNVHLTPQFNLDIFSTSLKTPLQIKEAVFLLYI